MTPSSKATTADVRRPAASLGKRHPGQQHQTLSATTVRLQMQDGHDIYFRAPKKEIHRLILRRHGQRKDEAGRLVIYTEKEVPIDLNVRDIQTIHIL